MQSPLAERRHRRTKRRLILATIISLTLAALGISFDPDQRQLIIQLELAALGVIAVLALTGVLRRAAPLAPRSPLDQRWRAPKPQPAPLPIDLVRVSRRLIASEASAADARRHLGPLVAAIAADRLQTYEHTDIDAVYFRLPQPVPAPLALVLDPALADVDTRELPGLDSDATDALVRALEQL